MAAAFDTALDAELTQWAEQTTGGRIVMQERLPGGNRREAWFVDVALANGTVRQLFLRCDHADPLETGEHYTIHREAIFYRAVAGTAVRAPALIAVHPARQAMLTERACGSAQYSRQADEETKLAVSRDLLRQLATLHRLPVAGLPAAVPGSRDTVTNAICDEIDIWQDLYEQTGTRDPMIELGLRWLRRNLPRDGRAPSLVHGDAGPGNFLFEGEQVTALLDWELAHIGDPMEDLAWLSMRSTLEPMPAFPSLLREYAAASGRAVDLDRVRYHRVLVEWRVLVIRHRQGGANLANSLMSWTLNRRLFLEAMAQAAGLVGELPDPVEAQASDRQQFYDTILASFRDVIVARSTDALVLAHSKSSARLVKLLAQHDTLGAGIAAADHADILRLLGLSQDDPMTPVRAQALLCERIRNGDIEDLPLYQFLFRKTARETQLMRPVMGALASRSFPPLEDVQA